ncbi:hypothetical protein ABPG74_017591 [Tetrahymena malaccensis]
MQMEEDASQSGYLDGRESQSHNQGDEEKIQESSYSELYDNIIISIIEEHNKIQNLADLYDIVLSKIDESLQDTESYEDIDLDELADECFKQLKVKLYDSFSKQIWQDKNTQIVSEYQKIEFIDDKLNESFDFFHTVSNLIVYLEQLQKQLMAGNKQNVQNKENSSMQNSSEKENPTESINLRQRKSAAAAPNSSVANGNYEGKQIGDRQKQKDNIVNFSENKAASASISSSSRTTSKRREKKQNNLSQPFGLQQSFCSNESLGVKGSNQNNLLLGDFRNNMQGEQKIFVRLNPLNLQTHQIQLYLQNFPRLEVKIGTNQCLSYLLEYLNRKWLQKQQNNGMQNNNCIFGICLYPDSESWLIEFKGQEKPKLSEQLMINDIYSGFNYPKDQVVNLLYEITKDQPPQPAPSLLQVSEWENHIQNTIPSPRLHIPLSPSRLGVDHEDNYHFLQQFSQDSDFRFFNYYENLFNEDDDEDYVVNEEEEEEEEDDEDDEEDYEDDEEVIEEDQDQQEKGTNVEKDDFQNQQQNDLNDKTQENQQNLVKQNKNQGEGEEQSNKLGLSENQNQKKKSNKNNKEDGQDQRQKSQNSHQNNRKSNEKKQKLSNNNQFYQNQQKMLQENQDLNNQYGNYGGNSELNYNEYQQNLMDECKDAQLISNFEINEFANVNQLNDYYSNQYKMQMNNRYRSQEDVDNMNQNDLQDQHHLHNSSINLDNSMLKQNSIRSNNLIATENLNNMGNNLSNMIGLGNLESQNFQKQISQSNCYEGYIDFNNDMSNNLNNNNMSNNNNANKNNNNGLNIQNTNTNDGFNSFSNIMNQESNHTRNAQEQQLENENNDNNSISLMISQQQNRQNQAHMQQIQNSLENQNANLQVKSPQANRGDKKKSKLQDKQAEKIKRQKQSSTVDQNPDEQIISLIKPNPYKDIEMFQKMKSKGNTNQNQYEETNYQIENVKYNKIEENNEGDQKKQQLNQPKNNIRPPSFQLNQTQKQKDDNEKEPKLQKFVKQNSSGNVNQDDKGQSNQKRQMNQNDNGEQNQQQTEDNMQNNQNEKTQQQLINLQDQQQLSNCYNNKEYGEEEDEEEEEFDDDNEEDDEDEEDEEEFDEEYSNNNQNENNQQKEKTEQMNQQNNQNQYNEQSQNLIKNTSPLQYKHNFSNFNLFNQDSYQFHNNQSYNFNSLNNIFNTTSNANIQNPLFNQHLNSTNSNLINKSLLKSPINPTQKKGGYTFKQNIFGEKNFNSNNFQNDNSIMNINSMAMRFDDPSSNFKNFDFPFSNLNQASNSRPFFNDKYTNTFTMSKFNQNSNLNSIPLYRNYQHSNQLSFAHHQFNHPFNSKRDIFADKTLSSETDKDNQQNTEKVVNEELQNKNDKNFPQINIIKSESTPSLGLKNEQDIKIEVTEKELSNQKQQQSSSQISQSETNKSEAMGFRKINVIKKEDAGTTGSLLGKRFLSEQGETRNSTKQDQISSENQTPLSVLNTEKIENLVKQIVGNQQNQDSIQENNNNNNQNDSQSQQDSLKYLQMNESNQEILGKNTSNNNNSSNIFKVRKLSVNQIQNQNSLNQAAKPTNNNSNSNFSKNVQEVHNAITNLLNNSSLASINNPNNTNNSELSKESANSNNLSNTEIKENYKFLKFQNEFAKYYSENLSKMEDQKLNSSSQQNSTQQALKAQLMRIDSTKAVSAILENVIASQQLKQANQSSVTSAQKLDTQLENNNSTLQNSLNNIEKQKSLGASSNQIENIKQIIQVKTASKTISPNYLSNLSETNNNNNNQLNDQSKDSSKQAAQNQSQNSQQQQQQNQQQATVRTDLQFLENLVELVGLKKNQVQNAQQLINQVKEVQINQNNKQQNNESQPNKNILVKSVSVVRKQNNNNSHTSQQISQKAEENNTKVSPDSSINQQKQNDQNVEGENKMESSTQKSNNQNSNETE